MRHRYDIVFGKYMGAVAGLAILFCIASATLIFISTDYVGYQTNFNRCASLNDSMPYGSYVPTISHDVLSHQVDKQKHWLIETSPGIFTKTYVACDESGSLFYDYRILVHNMVANWGFMSTYAGFEAGPEWNAKYDKLVEAGMPVNSTEVFPYKDAIEFAILEDLDRKPHMRNLEYMYGCAMNDMKHKNMLIRVAWNGCMGCVKHLVETHKVNVNHYDCNGVTAAGAAAMRGHFKVAMYLIPLMDEKYKNIQFNHMDYDPSLYSYMRFGDYTIGYGSGTMFKRFLIKHGFYGTTELRAQRGCFPRNAKYADDYREIFVSKRPYYHRLGHEEKTADIANCLFLYKQFVDRCEHYDLDCNKRDWIYQYIEDIGFSMHNWNNIRYYIDAYIPNDFNDKGDYEITASPGYYWMHKRMTINRNIQKRFVICNRLYTNCSKEVERPDHLMDTLPKYYLNTKPRRLKDVI